MGADLRRLIAFPCNGETLLGTLDGADGATGLLIVSGGNEVRSGAHRGMAALAASLAGQGVPVFRFDRRGVGDSSGENRGYASSGPDLRAAVATLRAEAPHVRRLFGLGNCDAAAALAMFGPAAGLDALILTNPWLSEEATDLPPRAAVAARVRARLRPSTWRQPPSFSAMLRGLRAVLAKRPEPELARLYVGPPLPTPVILAGRDRPAPVFRAAAKVSFVRIDTASHSFSEAPDRLQAAVLAALVTR